MPTESQLHAPLIALSLEDIVNRSQSRLHIVKGLVDELQWSDLSPLTGDPGAQQTAYETIEWCVTAVLEDLKLTEEWPAEIQNYHPRIGGAR